MPRGKIGGIQGGGFTLIELLVVIAILGVLATAVVLVLNPAQLLAQGRDSTRLSDLASLQSALSLFTTDAYTQSMGTSSIVYVSVPDSSPTCANLGLPALPSGYTFGCASTSTYTKVDGTGWIPVNFNLISSGSPLSKLPVDPVNSTSSGFYYTYSVGTNHTFELTAVPESQRYRSQFESNPTLPDHPGVIAYGSNLNASPLFSSTGLVGYWSLDGSASDLSGNGNDGTWYGTPSGTNGYYSAGKVGTYAGYFNGTDNYIQTNYPANFGINNFSISLWVNLNAVSRGDIVANGSMGMPNNGFHYWEENGTNINVRIGDGTNYVQVHNGGGNPGTWHYYTFVVDRASNQYLHYLDGKLGTPTSISTIGSMGGAFNFQMGGNNWMMLSGLLDDVRVYNRALSAAEVQAIYTAEK